MLIACLDSSLRKKTVLYQMSSADDSILGGFRASGVDPADIPYGPDRVPWRNTLSSWAVDGDKLLISSPTQDPATLYSTERDTTPSFYQVPSQGLDDRQRENAQEETWRRTAVLTENHLGYQGCGGGNYDVVSQYFGTFLNNTGDPYQPGSYNINTKWMERNVLDYYASLWNAKWPHDPKDPDTYWGYVLTMGSTEGNLYGMWNARDYLQGKFTMSDEALGRDHYVRVPATKINPHMYTPVAFYSQDSHYSLIKAMTVLDVKTFYQLGMQRYPGQSPVGDDWPEKVPSEGGDSGSGSIDIEALCKLVEFFAKEGYPILIIFNLGTTFKGAYDNVQTAGERVLDILKCYGLENRRIEFTNHSTGKTVTRWRKGYWIHVDGALGASYMPFLRMAYIKKRMDMVPPPAFDFQLPFVCSIITSGHKFPETPWPTGIYMTKTGLQLLPPSEPEYIGSRDATFAGSRNGLSALIFWTHISSYNYEAQIRKVMHCLDFTKYAEEQLKKVETERPDKLPLWIVRSPLSLAIRFRKPNDDIVYRFTLANEKLYYHGELRTYTRIYCMESTTKEKLDELFKALRDPLAFSKEQAALNR